MTTVIVEQLGAAEQGATLVAVPVGTGTPAQLVKLGANAGWDFRVSGAALVVSLQTSANTTRLAVLDLRSGESRWLSSEERGTIDRNPLWSPDGAFVYVGRSSASGDLGLFRLRADGSDLTRIRGPAPASFSSSPAAATTDGVLVWAELSGTRSAIGVLEPGSGRERSAGADSARFAAWRSARPRLLLERLAPASPPNLQAAAGALLVVDDLAGTATTLIDAPTIGADWDPTGTRLVASTRAAGDSFALVTMDASGGGRTNIAGSENATRPLWLRAGIVYVWDAQPGDVTQPRELRLIAPSGGAPRTLYRADGFMLRMQFVTP